MCIAGIKPDRAEFLRPMAMGFLIAIGGITCGHVRLIDRGVDALRWKFPHFDDQFPRPGDGFCLEIVAERPIPEHFEKRVMVRVEPDIFEVIVFAAGANALLGVGGASGSVGAFDLAEKDGHELIHAGIGEEQIRRIGHQTGGGHNRVLFRLEEIEKALAYLGASHWEWSYLLSIIDLPVISGGGSRPSSASRVGAISARIPSRTQKSAASAAT